MIRLPAIESGEAYRGTGDEQEEARHRQERHVHAALHPLHTQLTR